MAASERVAIAQECPSLPQLACAEKASNVDNAKEGDLTVFQIPPTATSAAIDRDAGTITERNERASPKSPERE